MVAQNAEQIPAATLEEIGRLSDEYESKISRGIQFRFMWIDATQEPEFAGIFNVQEYPSIVVMNPGKRKRFLIHENELSAEGVQKTLDKILGGDARFKNIKGNKLPALVSKYPTTE